MSKLKYRGKAITVTQPYASSIVYGGKDIENRSWYTHYRGPVAIHAGAKFYEHELFDKIRQITPQGYKTRTIEEWIGIGQKEGGCAQRRKRRS
jgi:hypothetical protein